jgi:hypothetical protein
MLKPKLITKKNNKKEISPPNHPLNILPEHLALHFLSLYVTNFLKIVQVPHDLLTLQRLLFEELLFCVKVVLNCEGYLLLTGVVF